MRKALISISFIITMSLSACQVATVPSETQSAVISEEHTETPSPISTETVTPTPTPTPTPTAEPTEISELESEQDSVIEESSENTEETTAGAQEVDEIEARTESLDKTMYAVSAVNVRAGDNTKYEQVGSLSWAQEVKVTGRSTESGWFRITLADGSEGYVSNKYLSESKPQQQKKATQAEAQAAQSGQISQQAAPATTSGGGLGASRGGVKGVTTGTGTAINGYNDALAGVNLH